MPSLPCFLCGNKLDQRTSKNNKPYFVCDPCGTQIFIRRPPGMENLQQLVRVLRSRNLPLHEHTAKLFEIRAVMAEINGIKDEIEKLDSGFGLLRLDKDKARAKKLLKTRLNALLAELGRLVKE